MNNCPACDVAEPVMETATTAREAPALLMSQTDMDRQTIAARLEDLAIELRSIPNERFETVPSAATLRNTARKLYKGRRAVDEIFGMDGFAVSPAWDIMLDLYQAQLQGKRISATSACIGGACPVTTGLRWLQALEASRLIVRTRDPDDKRRNDVALTESAVTKIELALAAYL